MSQNLIRRTAESQAQRRSYNNLQTDAILSHLEMR